ncbi:MAG: serine hydrolase, partial [Bacteroidia bacterium]|nr:serine hydrolase [Bacteroidia bacterium]
ASITPDAPHLLPGRRPNAKSKDGYGYQWWIPLGANDEFNAQGIYTQFIYIDPDKDMVIVKLSSNYHFKTDTTGYFHDHEIALYRTIAESL